MLIGLKRINFKVGLLIIFLFLLSLYSIAQPIACDPLIDPYCENVDAPLDSNLILLIIFGIVMGYLILQQRLLIRTVKIFKSFIHKKGMPSNIPFL
jgi:hypothetical protein